MKSINIITTLFLFMLFCTESFSRDSLINAQLGIGPFLDIGDKFTYTENNEYMEYEIKNEDGDIEEKKMHMKFDSGIDTKNGVSFGCGITLLSTLTLGIKIDKFRWDIFGIGLNSELGYLNSNLGNQVAVKGGIQWLFLIPVWTKCSIGKMLIDNELEYVDYYYKSENTDEYIPKKYKTNNDSYSLDFSFAVYPRVNKKDNLLIELYMNQIIHEKDNNGSYDRPAIRFGYIYNFYYMD